MNKKCYIKFQYDLKNMFIFIPIKVSKIYSSYLLIFLCGNLFFNIFVIINILSVYIHVTSFQLPLVFIQSNFFQQSDNIYYY